MATKREQILAAIKTNLANTTGVGTRIYRSRVEALTRSETPALILEPISDTPQDTQSFNDKVTWEFKIRISVVARGSVPHNDADPTIGMLGIILLAVFGSSVTITNFIFGLLSLI